MIVKRLFVVILSIFIFVKISFAEEKKRESDYCCGGGYGCVECSSNYYEAFQDCLNTRQFTSEECFEKIFPQKAMELQGKNKLEGTYNQRKNAAEEWLKNPRW